MKKIQSFLSQAQLALAKDKPDDRGKWLAHHELVSVNSAHPRARPMFHWRRLPSWYNRGKKYDGAKLRAVRAERGV